MGRGERGAVLDDGVLGMPVLVGAAIERAVHGKDVGGEVEHQRIRALGDQIDGQIVDRLGADERLEQRLEVRALLQAVHRPHHVLGGKRAAGLELHPLAQMKPRGAVVDRLVALGEARLDGEVLLEADQGIEQEMRHLQRRAGQLLMRIERCRVGIVGHAQSLCLGLSQMARTRATPRRQQVRKAA